MSPCERCESSQHHARFVISRCPGLMDILSWTHRNEVTPSEASTPVVYQKDLERNVALTLAFFLSNGRMADADWSIVGCGRGARDRVRGVEAPVGRSDRQDIRSDM
jgi:hypothetical protein